MNSEYLVVAAVVFLILWLITSLIWSWWLDGVIVPIAGCFTSLAVLGAVTIVITIKR